jgi:Tol biopolymer transport system component
MSFDQDISATGRYVAFTSYASNLVAGDTNQSPDVFVRDRRTGTSSRVSVSSTEAQGNGSSDDTAISADGRYVACSWRYDVAPSASRRCRIAATVFGRGSACVYSITSATTKGTA